MLAAADLIDVAIAVTVAELAALLAYRRWTGRGIAARRLLPNVAAGLFLMLALHVAVADSRSPWLVALLACAGVAHAVDLRWRWKDEGRRGHVGA